MLVRTIPKQSVKRKPELLRHSHLKLMMGRMLGVESGCLI